MSALDDKRALRARLKARLRELGTEVSAQAGVAVAGHLLSVIASRGGPVAFFASLPWELSTTPLDDALRANGRRRVLPAVAGDDLVFRALPADTRAVDLPRDRMGIPTPPSYLPVVSLARCGWVLVPGLAFDDDGRRLGYGRGYYDRALSLVDPERCIGLLLDEQRVPRVPVEAYDVRLRWTCSPRGLMSHPSS